MISKEVLEYIKTNMSSGMTKESIYSNLINEGGWNKEDVDHAFLSIESSVPVKPVSESVQGSAPDTGVVEPVSVKSQPQPIQTTQQAQSAPVIQTVQPGFQKQVSVSNIQNSGSGGGLLKIIISILILGVFGVGGYFAYGYFDLFSKSITLEDVIESTGNVKAVSYSLDINSKLSQDYFGGEGSSVGVHIENYIDTFDSDDYKSTAKLSMTAPDLFGNFGLELIVVDEELFVYVSKLPSILGIFGISDDIEGRWIDTQYKTLLPTAKEFIDLAEDIPLNTDLDTEELNRRYMTLFKSFWTNEYSEFLIIEKGDNETVYGRDLSKYNFILDVDVFMLRISEFYRESYEEIFNQDLPSEYDINPEDYKDIVLWDVTGSVWVSVKDKLIYAASIEVESEGGLKTLIDLDVKSYNEPLDIEEPEDVVLISDIVPGLSDDIEPSDGSLVLGSLVSAQAKSRDARRISDIKQLQLAQELYFDSNREYAANLTLLIGQYLPALPKDPSTGKDYLFSISPEGKNYHLGAVLENKDSSALQSGGSWSNFDSLRVGWKNGFRGDSLDCTLSRGSYDLCYDVVAYDPAAY